MSATESSWTARAALFDLDGVLADSRVSVDAAWSTWAVRHGIEIERVRRVLHGRRAAETVATFLPQADVEAEIGRIYAHELASLATLRPIPGARTFVATVSAGRWAVVTSGPRSVAQARLETVGIPIPPVFITAELVRNGKPDPEPYRLAAQRLGVCAADCVVFEDAPAGIAAGKASGARVIALATTYAAPDLGAADAVIADFTCLSAHLGEGVLHFALA